MYVVIMAGGGGTRLRPLSTAARPKPFLPLLPTGETLLERTVARLRGPELGLSDADICVVASAAYAPLVRRQVPGIGVVVEPEGRNTAAAIALATLAIERDDDDVMVVLPADHRIDPDREGLFRSVLRAAGEGLATGAFGVESPLVTLGIRPTHPSTQYGYLVPRVEAGEDVAGLRAYPLAAFREKPSPTDAETLVASPGVAWNAGMFLWRRRAIRAALERPRAGDRGRRGGWPRLGRPRGGLPAPALALDRLRRDGAGGCGRRGRHGRRWTSAGATSGRGPRCSRSSGPRAWMAASSRRARRSMRPPRTCSSNGIATGWSSTRGWVR